MTLITGSSLAAFTFVIACLANAGCESSPKGSLQKAQTEYQTRNFAQAESTASKAMANSEGDAKYQAAYVAGMSAYQQGKIREAEGNLLVAADSTVPDTAGRARAMLGLIRMKQDRPAEAAIHFSTAAPLLQGDDARNAAALAATAHQRAGNDSAARTWQARASSAPGSDSATPSSSSARRAGGTVSARFSDPATSDTASGLATHATRHPASVSHPIQSAPPIAGPLGKGFSLQVGAFKDRQHAQQAATDAQRVSQDNGLGGVRIVAADDSFGQTLHLVQLGHFESRAAAAAARQRIGKLQYIVAPAAATATN